METNEVSIIVPLYNQVAFTRVCNEYLVRNTDPGFETVYVDNGSSDDTPRFLAGLGGRVQKVINPGNLGFAKACNQGARAAQGRYLVFLNNDTAVHKGWLGPLLDALRTRREIGIAGPKLIYPDNTIQQAGVVFWETGLPYHLYAGCSADLPGANKARFFQAVTGACFMVSKEDFFAAGGFDEAYLNGLEDIDLCLKLGERGKGVFYQPESVVTHFESRSENRQAAMVRNRDLFMARWRDILLFDDYRYFAQDGMECLVTDIGTFEFKTRETMARIVTEKIAPGLVYEKSGEVAKALEHYKYVFGHSPGNPLILERIEALSRKVGLTDVAESFRQRRIKFLDANPEFGRGPRPVERKPAPAA